MYVSISVQYSLQTRTRWVTFWVHSILSRVIILKMCMVDSESFVSAQPTMTPSGRQRGAGVNQTHQKPSSLVRWTTWSKSGNGKWPHAETLCGYFCWQARVIITPSAFCRRDSALQVRRQAGAAVDAGGSPAGCGLCRHQSQWRHRCLQLPGRSHPPLGPGVGEADQVHGCWTR